MKILAVGGGSGGHVTPIAAVLSALLVEHPHADIRVWCDKSFELHAKRTMEQLTKEVRVDTVLSGKFRRYHSLPIWKQLMMIRTIVLPNIIDTIKITGGVAQSIGKLIIWRPDVIFCKGGYVCLPVGVAALLLRIPIVLHDSDAHAGLTNRILSKWAKKIATGATLDHYNYPIDKSTYVGIPIAAGYKKYSMKKQQSCKDSLGFEQNRPLVVVTGGGLGARTINTAVIESCAVLSEKTNLILISGSTDYTMLSQSDAYLQHTASMRLYDFVGPEMIEMLIAADVVITRAGATTLLELAALGKPTIIIPNPYLTGNHQTKNADVYEDKDAAIVLMEKDIVDTPQMLSSSVIALIQDKAKQQALSFAIHTLAKPGAARDVADMIISVAHPKKKIKL